MVYSLLNSPWVIKKAFVWLHRPFFGYIPPSIAKKGGIFLKRRWYVAKVVYSLIGIYDIPAPGGPGLGRAGGQGPDAPAPPASLSLGLDWIITTHEPNAAIGLVTSATASIMAGSSLVRWEVRGAMPGLPGLTPLAYIPIDSNTGHVRVRVETEADKDYCKTECCRHQWTHHTGRQPASHANEWPL